MLYNTVKQLTFTALVAAVVVVTAVLVFVNVNLPDNPGEALDFQAGSFQFAFGSGHPVADRMVIDDYVDGSVLLTSGPVSIQAKKNSILKYTWLPTKLIQEAVFFWRQKNVTDEVIRTSIHLAGTHYVNLSLHPDWYGEITEFGFLLIDESSSGHKQGSVEVGPLALLPDHLDIHLQLVWQDWTVFEERTQQSINFLHGGGRSQDIPLPIVVSTWLILTIFLFWLTERYGTRLGPKCKPGAYVLLCLAAWMLLDVRWTTNNLRQIGFSLPKLWQMSEQQRLASDLDGEIFQFVENLKSEILGGKTSRVLIVGSQGVPDYYLERAKYHLLPHSANVTRMFAPKSILKSLDFVICFGQPDSLGQVSGWSSYWQQGLEQVNTSQWGTVYKVRKDHDD